MALVSRKSTRIALAALGGLVLVLVLAQLLLPALAARIAREQIGRYGTVRSVSVRAFPAIELLWGRADSARIEAAQLRMSDSQFDAVLPRLRGVRSVDMTIDGLQLGSLRAQDVRFAKRGAEIEMRAAVTQADIQSALPPGVDVALVPSASGGLAIRVSGSLFGFGASLLAVLGVYEGKIVAQPQGIPFAGLARLTVFSDPRLAVQDVALSGSSGAGADGPYTLTLRAALR